MKTILRKLSSNQGRPNGSWLTLVLLPVVLVPSVCLLWFMNRAVQNERLAVRQKLVDAYRGHLTLAQERLEAQWGKTASDLEAPAGDLPAPAIFSKQVRAGLADAVICFDLAGNIIYPSLVLPPEGAAFDASWMEVQRLESSDPDAAASAFARLAAQATNDNFAARALQAQARCLVRAGKKEAAISVLIVSLVDPRYRRAMDSQGRLITPNAELMALELLKDSAPDQMGATFQHLKTRLLDYGDPAMSAPQRRFLMHELERLFPDQARFPTLAAEDLAARYLETDPKRPGEPALRATSLPGLWQFGSHRGSEVRLYQTETLLARMRAAIASPTLPADVRMELLAPGQDAGGSLLSLSAGPSLPGWRLALSLKDQRLFEAAADQQITSYVWIGVLVLATAAVFALLALRLVRRQMELTQLKNDLVANVTHELKTPLSSMRLLVDTLLNSAQLHESTAREYLQIIATENARLSRLIDNFLTFSRMERNKYVFDFNEVPAATIIEGATAAVGERFNVRGCRFEVQVTPDLPVVLADTDAMVTALLNLLDNAYKYSGEEKQITLSAGVENGGVFFAIKDNGIGLPPRDAKRIFKRFYQVDQRLSRTSGGCGLGLSIVRFVVTAHSGTVQVESQPGRGSTFIILLPAAGARHNQEAKP